MQINRLCRRLACRAWLHSKHFDLGTGREWAWWDRGVVWGTRFDRHSTIGRSGNLIYAKVYA